MDLIIYPTPQLVVQHNVEKLGKNIGHIGRVPITFDVFVENTIRHEVLHLSQIGDFKKNLLIYYIAEMLKSKKKLSFFNQIREGYVSSISELIGEFKRQDILFTDLLEILPDTPKNRDVSLIYKNYQRLLKENNLYDREDRYLFLKNHISKNKYISNYNNIVFRNFYGFTTVQQKIINALGNRAKVIDDPLNIKLQDIEIVKAQDRKTEVWNLAHKINEDLSNGFKADKICIVLRERDLYANDIFEIFEKIHIPVSMSGQALLLENSFIKAFINEDITVYFNETLKERDKVQSIGSWAKKVRCFLSDQGYPEKICDIHNGNLEYIKRDAEAYSIFNDILEALEFITFPDIKFFKFKETLYHLLQRYIYNPLPQSKGIFITSPTMLRGLYFDKIYVLGMIDGEFPRAFKPDWLLKDEIRCTINQNGYNIDTLDILLKRERQSFDFILSCSENGYFSYPEIIEDFKQTLISSYLEDLINLDDNKVCKKTVDFSSVFCCESKETNKSSLAAKNKEHLKQKVVEKLQAKPLSITALNTYGQCPYKFFLSNIMNLRKEEDEDYTALERGIICHKVLELFFKNHKGDLDQNKLEFYSKEVEFLTKQVMIEKGFNRFFPHPGLCDIERQDISSKINQYVDYHIKNRGNFRPYLFEFGFGYNKDFCLDFLPGIKFCGKIDRVDINPEGKVIIYDYKNNWTPDINALHDGVDLQMPFYILAAEKLFNREVLGGAFISIKDGKIGNVFVKDVDLPFISKNRRKGIFDESGWEEFLSTTKEITSKYVQNIMNAYFPMEPKKCPKIEQFGSFCDFTNICPMEG